MENINAELCTSRELNLTIQHWVTRFEITETESIIPKDVIGTPFRHIFVLIIFLWFLLYAYFMFWEISISFLSESQLLLVDASLLSILWAENPAESVNKLI